MIGALAACSSQEDAPAPPASISITGASVVTQEGGDPFVTMDLTVSAPDQLTAVEVGADIAESVQLTDPGPESIAPTDEDPAPIVAGVPIDAVALSAGDPTTFGPGSYGMWLIGPKELEAESTITITLTLQDAGPVVVEAPVR